MRSILFFGKEKAVSQATSQTKTVETPEVQKLREATELGDAEAQYNLGVMYDNGQGVVKDKDEAVNWYRRAAEQGHAPEYIN